MAPRTNTVYGFICSTKKEKDSEQTYEISPSNIVTTSVHNFVVLHSNLHIYRVIVLVFVLASTTTTRLKINNCNIDILTIYLKCTQLA